MDLKTKRSHLNKDYFLQNAEQTFQSSPARVKELASLVHYQQGYHSLEWDHSYVDLSAVTLTTATTAKTTTTNMTTTTTAFAIFQEQFSAHKNTLLEPDICAGWCFMVTWCITRTRWRRVKTLGQHQVGVNLQSHAQHQLWISTWHIFHEFHKIMPG